jgi:dTDP-4-dehydrorhamnose 3,5-epimerase
MKFIESELKGAYIIEIEPIEDYRGFFARSFCWTEFEQYGLNPHIAQCSISFNNKRGTIRGMHYQEKPHEEVKLVRSTMGAIYDVIVDIRRESPTFLKWIGIELSAKNRKMLYVPEGFAHGFQTLEHNTEVFYQISQFYHPESSKGIRWDDSTINIKWPISKIVFSERDSLLPLIKL